MGMSVAHGRRRELVKKEVRTLREVALLKLSLNQKSVSECRVRSVQTLI